jgi:hypothetical protein
LAFHVTPLRCNNDMPGIELHRPALEGLFLGYQFLCAGKLGL